MNDVYDRLVGLLTRGFGIEPDEVSAETTFNELEMDSLALVELGLAAQDEFGVKIEDDDIRSSDSIGQAAEAIAAKAVSIG
ncbi:acyl carrier protein [Kitasatospora griseola]|uniref:acyl carrier protein n=1 Tax=Kitasatospora griseola TaxID=2064 RepID=UPI0038246D64